jgi:hypothetical protein
MFSRSTLILSWCQIQDSTSVLQRSNWFIPAKTGAQEARNAAMSILYINIVLREGYKIGILIGTKPIKMRRINEKL